MKKILVLLGGIALAMTITTILTSKNEEERFKRKIKYKEVDFLDMGYVKDFFHKRYKKVIEKNSEALAIILKLNLGEQLLYVFTFYNEKKENIIDDKTRIVNAKSISQDFKDAFADKDMLVLT